MTHVKKTTKKGRRIAKDNGIKGKKTVAKKRATSKKRAEPAGAPAGDSADAASPVTRAAKVDARLYAAGLGGLARSTSPAESSLLAAAYLSKAAGGKGGRSTDTSGKRKQPDDVKLGETLLIMPGSPEWSRILKRLLSDSSYVADAGVEKLPADDLVRILSGMPFELRRHALEPYAAGVRHFMKVPYHIGGTQPATYTLHEEFRKQVRSLACPEPPAEGQAFGLAWFEGQFLESVPPSTINPRDVRADLGIRRVEQMLGFDFDKELSGSAECLATGADRARMATEKQVLCSKSADYIQRFGEEIAGILSQADPRTRKLAEKAFALGVIYCRELVYPGCADAWRELAFGSGGVWTDIVRLALVRHGQDTERKELLRRLGCENHADYKKDSRAEARFPKQHASVTPQITFTAFDKAYKEAIKALKALRDESGYAVQQLHQNALVERARQSEGQRRRSAGTKKKVRVYDEAVEKKNRDDEEKRNEEIRLGAEVARKEDARAKNKQAKQVLENR